jgi:GNAT superfamily N-acetyltransferase
MIILQSNLQDLPTILSLYESAIAHQKKVFTKYWQPFDPKLIEREIQEKRQWKMVVDNEIACIFAITYNDPAIWKEKDADPSIYLHRIVTHPSHRGKFFVKDIIQWARLFCKQEGKRFIRMDTFGDNDKLIQYYVSCGFNFLGLTTVEAGAGLPKHYDNATLSLFEIEV